MIKGKVDLEKIYYNRRQLNRENFFTDKNVAYYRNDNMTTEDRQAKRQADDNKKNFYYSNTYVSNDDAHFMAINVNRDLKPFQNYLTNSIQNLNDASKIGAECFEVKNKIILKPKFSLIKVKASKYCVINRPTSNYYVLDWNDEWGNIDKFDAIQKGRYTLVESRDIIDTYNKKLIFILAEDIDTTIQYKLYIQGNDDEYTCSLRLIKYDDLQDVRVSGIGMNVISISESNGKITVYYTGVADDNVLLFGSIPCEIIEKDEMNINRDFIMYGAKVSLYDENNGYLLVDVDDSDLTELYSDQSIVEYDIVSRETICTIIDSSDIKYSSSDNKIEIINNKFGNKGDAIIIKGLKFEVDSPLENTTRALKNKRTHEYVGTIIEIKEDDSVKNDVYSNVTYFFSEATEYLSDSPIKGEGNRYRIGRKFDRFNQLEICLETKNHELLPIENMPTYLYIEPNTRQLMMQSYALNVLRKMPRKEHMALLELMHDKEHANWTNVDYSNVYIDKWYKLTDSQYDGCDSQREFVKKTLATPDFAILEGPPGSGKTTTILEIIAQMIMHGQKVMLAASTNAAIDNILERIDTLPPEVSKKILAVRLGTEGMISESVNNYVVDSINDREIQNEIIKRANLVCGTTIGVLKHPEFNLAPSSSVVPIFDCLIVDEASKTTFQEFLVPAIFAKKWVLSGDLKQLTPYIEQDSIAASLTKIDNFDINAQQAQSLLMMLRHEIYGRRDDKLKQMRFCICVNEKVLDAATKLAIDYPEIRIAVVSSAHYDTAISVEDFLNGSERAALIYGANVLFVSHDDYEKIVAYLPCDYISIMEDGKDILAFENMSRYKKLDVQAFNSNIKSITKFKEDLLHEIKNKTWAGEIAWRLCRIQELFLLDKLNKGNDTTKMRYMEQIASRIPSYARNNVMDTISLLQEIALPSIIQLLQQGVGNRDIIQNKKWTTLNSGFDEYGLQPRHTLVKYQHRMHNDISAFSRKYIYEGVALENGSFINRDWSYKEYPSRAYWLDVKGKLSKGKNIQEAEQIICEIQKFLKFAKDNPKPNDEPWTIACLTYYRAQETEIKGQIKKILKESSARNYYKLKDVSVEIMVYTVDKFQGKEADIVYLSMIKTGDVNLGFMDSPNRLNVALTRAKYQMVIVGDKDYFRSNICKSDLLKLVVEEY